MFRSDRTLGAAGLAFMVLVLCRLLPWFIDEFPKWQQEAQEQREKEQRRQEELKRSLQQQILDTQMDRRLLAVAKAYLAATKATGQSPKAVEELRPWIASGEDVVSLRDGRPLEIPTSLPSKLESSLLVWEATADAYGRHQVYVVGARPSRVSEDEFQRLRSLLPGAVRPAAPGPAKQ